MIPEYENRKQNKLISIRRQWDDKTTKREMITRFHHFRWITKRTLCMKPARFQCLFDWSDKQNDCTGQGKWKCENVWIILITRGTLLGIYFLIAGRGFRMETPRVTNWTSSEFPNFPSWQTKNYFTRKKFISGPLKFKPLKSVEI